MIDRRHLILSLAAVGATAAAQTPPPSGGARIPGLGEPAETIDLWPKGVPGSPATLPVEMVEERSKDPGVADREVHGIARPRMVVFRPAIPNGAALLLVPGGGYRLIVIDKEGYEVARWLAARGFTVFVLFHRLPGDGWKAGPDVALSDAQRAIRLIRHRARDYGVMPDHVGVMGFSAGGHVCGDLATRYGTRTYAPVDAADRLSARPDIAAPIYAVQSMSLPLAHPGSRALLIGADATPALERAHSTAANVTATTPPIFLVHAEDDDVVSVANTLEMRAACRRAGVSVETHLFANGGHGFGLRRAIGKPVAAWPMLFVEWARSQGFA